VTQTLGRNATRGDPDGIRQAIDRFVESAKQPALMEPGDESIAIVRENFVLTQQGSALVLQAWDERRNLVRRITAVHAESRGRLELRFERFGKKTGTLLLVDLDRGARDRLELRAGRLEFREQFRRFLRRQFPEYRVAELSTESNLEESLSPAYPRALLRQGSSAWAAIGASHDAQNAGGVLSFGLIWLDYLRRRDPDLTIRGLILLLPLGHEKTTCLRLRHLNTAVAEFRAFGSTEDGVESALDLRDYGNVDTQLVPVRRRVPTAADAFIASIAKNPAVETLARPDGEISLRVRGLEFARTEGDRIVFRQETNAIATASNLAEIERIADRLSRARSHDTAEKLHPLYLKGRELWLESQVRAHMDEIDAALFPAPVYSQTTTLAGPDRGLVDLLASDRHGRLAILELKASQDIHLPLQALDYWIHVNWHLARGEFESAGYFPDLRLRPESPRMLLVAPALEFHPSNERVLRFFSPEIEVQRIGVGAAWPRELKIMFRM